MIESESNRRAGFHVQVKQRLMDQHDWQENIVESAKSLIVHSYEEN
jgi:hypothetical protein